MSAPAVRWSEAALALFRLEAPTGVSAGAGAGKTTALVELLLRILAGETPLGPCEPREVVAITFTERAAAELRERLGRALADAVGGALAEGATDRALCLAEARRGLGAMAVGTIHGFAARLLREHAAEARVDPDFSVLEEDVAEEALSAAAVAAAVAALDSGSEAERALAAGHGGVRGLATLAAGLARERSTRGLSGAPGAATGDRAALAGAAASLEASVVDLLSCAGTATTGSGRAALAALAEAWPASRAGAVAGLDEALASLVEPVRRWRVGKADPLALREARERFLAAALALPALAAEVAAAPQAQALAALVEDVGRRYGAAKAAAGALDFDDLLARARDLLFFAPAVRRELRGGTRALLVDEYQDVNGLQSEIFEMLAGGGAGEGRPAVLVAVGDAKQSIYRFRGADVGVFAGLLERLGPGGEGRVLHLRENHRSVPGVIDLVNDVLDRDARGLGVPFGPEDRLSAARAGGPSPAAELISVGAEGSAADRRDREALALAGRIREIVDGRAGVEVRDAATGSWRRPRHGDVAVLLRRLTHVAVYERALRQVGIPCRLARGGGFYQASEVRDLGELAASLADPRDGVAWAALLRSPLCGLSDGSLFLLARAGLSRLPDLDPQDAVAGLEAAAGATLGGGEGIAWGASSGPGTACGEPATGSTSGSSSPAPPRSSTSRRPCCRARTASVGRRTSARRSSWRARPPPGA